jgi:c-di-GMP-binding flagellar brake protein YcgR
VIEKAQLGLSPSADENASHAEIVNVSAGGAGVLLPIRVNKGTQVRLQIQGKHIEEVDLEAEVRWAAQSPVSTGKYPAGLKFPPLEEQRQKKLHALIESMQRHHPRI